MELLFEKEGVAIYYIPEHVIVTEWRGYFETIYIKQGGEAAIHFMKEKDCLRNLVDCTKAKGTFLQSIKWLKHEFLPNIEKLKGLRTAYLVPNDLVIIRAVERLLEVSSEVEAQMFLEYKAAMNWLLMDRRDAPPSTTTNESSGKLNIKVKDGIIMLDYHDILYIFSEDKGTTFQCRSGTYHSRESFKSFFSRLPRNFIQVHRSYIVNADYVLAIRHYKSGSYHLFLKNMEGIKIPVSKKNVPILKKILHL